MNLRHARFLLLNPLATPECLVAQNFEEQDLSVAGPELVRDRLVLAEDVSLHLGEHVTLEEHVCEFLLHDILAETDDDLMLRDPLTVLDPIAQKKLVAQSDLEESL